MTIQRIFYASAGRANLIRSHEFWLNGANNPDEVSLTFSGQIESFVEEMDGEALMVSECADGRQIRDGRFAIEHWPAQASGSGLAFYWTELRKAWRMARAARKFGADLAILDSGVMPFFMMALFNLFRVPVVVILHNTIWAHGFRPANGARLLLNKLDGVYFRRWPAAVIAVSPEAARQVDEIAPAHKCPVVEIRAQFEGEYFENIPPPPDWGSSTFNMMFIGRVHQDKGVLDIADMARQVEQVLPGRVKWTICGRGSALEALQAEIAKDLQGVVNARGWTSLEDLFGEVYPNTHASIVPTRSGFAEGLAMTAAEAIMAGRPVVTNPVVPAHEILAPAVILGRTNDPASHAEAVIRLASDRDLYERLRAGTKALGTDFQDRSKGLTAVLHRVASMVDTR